MRTSFQTAELAMFTLKKITVPDHIVGSRVEIKFGWQLRFQEAELYWSRGETSLALHLMEKLISELVCLYIMCVCMRACVRTCVRACVNHGGICPYYWDLPEQTPCFAVVAILYAHNQMM